LRGGSPGPLAGVVRHNRMDLRGLVALFGKLNSLLNNEPLETAEGLDLFGLSRYLHRRGAAERAESTCIAARDCGLPLPFDRQAQRELARMAKRRGEYLRAATIWADLLQDDQFRLVACEELAVYHERRTKNFGKALEYARLGIKELRAQCAGSSYLSRTAAALRRMEQLTKRAARLELKLAKTHGGRAAPLLKRLRSSTTQE
jgi:lipopolysaccharide biosynthesis regulator YciM